jgi:hypothetical protein
MRSSFVGDDCLLLQQHSVYPEQHFSPELAKRSLGVYPAPHDLFLRQDQQTGFCHGPCAYNRVPRSNRRYYMRRRPDR